MDVDVSGQMSQRQKRMSRGFMSTRQKESDGSEMSRSERSSSSARSRRLRNKFQSKKKECSVDSDDASMQSEEPVMKNKATTFLQSLQSHDKNTQG